MEILLRLAVIPVNALMVISPVVRGIGSRLGQEVQPACQRAVAVDNARSESPVGEVASDSARLGGSGCAEALTRRNSACCSATPGVPQRRRSPLLAAIALVASLLAAPALAMSAASDDDEPPSPAVTMQIYQTIDAWVREMSVPGDPAAAGLPEVSAAAVALRLGGRVIGRGSDATGDETTVWRAVRRAIEQAERRMPPEYDALGGDVRRGLAERITVSLELAGPLIPIDPEQAASADVLLAPGLDGVAARIDDRTSVMFPETMLATNTTPRVAFSAVISDAAGSPQLGLADPRAVAEDLGARFFRFRVAHAAQIAPISEPVFLLRAGRLISVAELGATDLRAMADSIAAHLLTRADGDAGAGVYRGTYMPWRDGYEHDDAPAHERSLVALTLARYARAPGVDEQTAGDAARLAAGLLGALAAPAPGQPGAWDDTAAAALVIVAHGELSRALADQPRPAGADRQAMDDLLDACRRRVRSAFDFDDGFAAARPGVAGLVALALVEIASESPDDEQARALASGAVRRVFRDTPDGGLVTHMPWLGWAEVRLVAIESEVRGEDLDVPAAVSLRRMRSTLWQHQLNEFDAGPDGQDLVGGILFTAARNPLPTWHAARPLAFAATMLAHPALTEPAESSGELARLLTSLRFLRQLQADESVVWIYPAPERALGAVRAALWDQRMPADASCFALLTVCETLESLDRMTRR